ncbi:ABC transporter ATP-binding protein [Cutibacterium avidum]|uniref:ABC transporter ATP-binding protein n=1 Tax=Cutibacterium avidum TaxID=33010 RepID=UPI0020931A37|nr:ABC transporter ATP-binding protein [Cutibacterium avidum]MCO6679212.1 ABC transporter ATP-binding protein [Cutibacterium avidum]
MISAVRLEGLTRKFRSGGEVVTALDRVNLEVPQGQLVAILGENGAGKTTLTKILSTMLYPSGGGAAVFGNDVVRDANKVRIDTTAIFGGDRGLYEMLSGSDNLEYFGALHGVKRRDLRHRIPQLLSQVGLEEAGRRAVQTYSKGMRQRLHIAVGLLTEPRLLLLDEPTVGLDPNESERLRGVVGEMHATGTTVLLTSHNLLDVERLAERVVMISHGSITHDLPLGDFRRLTGLDAVVTAQIRRGGGIHQTVTPIPRWSADSLAALAQQFESEEIIDLDVRPSTLEDAFALVSGKTLGGM